MNKMKTTNTTIGLLVAVLVLGGAGAYAFSRTYDNDNNQSNSSGLMEKDSSDAMEKDDKMMEGSEDSTMMKKTDEKYISLADFGGAKDSYSDNTKVLFFHASWCSICQSIEKEINADPSRIPDRTTFIKTDFDSETDLRKKYGVNNQYTFVQIDNDGNQIAKWSATSLDSAIDGIKS